MTFVPTVIRGGIQRSPSTILAVPPSVAYPQQSKENSLSDSGEFLEWVFVQNVFSDFSFFFFLWNKIHWCLQAENILQRKSGFCTVVVGHREWGSRADAPAATCRTWVSANWPRVKNIFRNLSLSSPFYPPDPSLSLQYQEPSPFRWHREQTVPSSGGNTFHIMYTVIERCMHLNVDKDQKMYLKAIPL